MFETIVVPLDGSELAEQALQPATELAQRLGSKVLLVQAVDSIAQRMAVAPAIMDTPAGAASNFQLMQGALDAEKESAREYLSAVRDRLTSQQIACEAFVGEGPAADVILGVVEQNKAGMIALSTHGRGGLSRMIYGSTADAVLRRSTVPVLIVRAKDGS